METHGLRKNTSFWFPVRLGTYILCNKGCQVSWNGQSKVACHQVIIPERNYGMTHAHCSRSNQNLLSTSICNFIFCFCPWIHFRFCWLMEGWVSSIVFSWGSSTTLFEVLLLLLNSDQFFPFTNCSVFVAINPCMLNAWLIVFVRNLHSCLMISFVHA